MKPYEIVKSKRHLDTEWVAVEWKQRIPKQVYGELMNALYKSIPKLRLSNEMSCMFIPQSSLDAFSETVERFLGPDVSELEEAFRK